MPATNTEIGKTPIAASIITPMIWPSTAGGAHR